MTDARGRLAAAQAELVAALVVHGPAPAGFPADRIQATARVLLHKRAERIAGHWPLLADALGEELLPAVDRILSSVPPGGGLRDGWRLARALRDTDQLPADALVELLAVRATYAERDGRVRRRRGITVRFGRCGNRTTVVLRVGNRLRTLG